LTQYVKIRDEEAVKNNAVYLALGGAPRRDHGYPRDMDRTERGAKFWLRVMTEIQNRGVSDILIAKLLYLALRNITKDWKMCISQHFI
jgi:transposase-like protein